MMCSGRQLTFQSFQHSPPQSTNPWYQPSRRIFPLVQSSIFRCSIWCVLPSSSNRSGGIGNSTRNRGVGPFQSGRATRKHVSRLDHCTGIDNIHWYVLTPVDLGPLSNTDRHPNHCIRLNTPHADSWYRSIQNESRTRYFDSRRASNPSTRSSVNRNIIVLYLKRRGKRHRTDATGDIICSRSPWERVDRSIEGTVP